MVVRKTSIGSANWKLTSPLWSGGNDLSKPLTPAKMASALRAAAKDKDIGANGAKVLKTAYTQAKAAAGKAPTGAQVREQIAKVVTSFSNERAKGRVNDGILDKREAGLTKGDLAAALYRFMLGSKAFNTAEPSDKELKTRATPAQLGKALRTLGPVIDAGFKLFNADPDKYQDGPGDALRAAAGTAGLSSLGRAAMMTALNGATSHGDGDGWPDAARVKGLLTNAQAKLKLADGAAIVDLAHPEKAPTKKKDGVTTGLELDRTPAATGMTSRALLAYAATL